MIRTKTHLEVLNHHMASYHSHLNCHHHIALLNKNLNSNEKGGKSLLRMLHALNSHSYFQWFLMSPARGGKIALPLERRGEYDSLSHQVRNFIAFWLVFGFFCLIGSYQGKLIPEDILVHRTTGGFILTLPLNSVHSSCDSAIY